ncbi:hypothetical protein BN903_45 [Halorubrum sp. AJ67]|nr:hypothetical protein BN903_45 [Halorubrum sp. AJ67]
MVGEVDVGVLAVVPNGAGRTADQQEYLERLSRTVVPHLPVDAESRWWIVNVGVSRGTMGIKYREYDTMVLWHRITSHITERQG